MLHAPNRFCSPYGVQRCSVFFAVIFMAFMIGATSCGKKGPPVPQTFVEPPVVKGLQTILEHNIATLRWPIPDWEEKGKDFLAGFYVYRSQIPFSEKECENCPIRYRKVADILIKDNTCTGSYSEQLASGFRYSFKVSVYTDSGFEGEKSEIIEIDF